MFKGFSEIYDTKMQNEGSNELMSIRILGLTRVASTFSSFHIFLGWAQLCYSFFFLDNLGLYALQMNICSTTSRDEPDQSNPGVSG